MFYRTRKICVKYVRIRLHRRENYCAFLEKRHSSTTACVRGCKRTNDIGVGYRVNTTSSGKIYDLIFSRCHFFPIRTCILLFYNIYNNIKI